MSNTKKNLNKTTNQEPIKTKVTVGSDDIIEKSELCKVIYVDNLIYINFKGFGLIAKNEKGYTEPELNVFYFGEIGEPNFKFRI